MSQTIIDVPDF